MKQTNAVHKKIGDAEFYICPFAAFTAARISGDLAGALTPLIAAFVPLFAKEDSAENDDKDITPTIQAAFSGVSGEKVEWLMKALLTDNGNISVECKETDGETMRLDEDLVNEIFCGDIGNLYVLCYEVIKLNFGSFFGSISARFGSRQTEALKTTLTSASMGSST